MAISFFHAGWVRELLQGRGEGVPILHFPGSPQDFIKAHQPPPVWLKKEITKSANATYLENY